MLKRAFFKKNQLPRAVSNCPVFVSSKWKEVSATAGEVMEEIEAYVGEYRPKTAAFSLGTDEDADGGGKILFNRQVCSFLFIKTSQAAAFRAGTIEDTDYSLQVLTGRDGQVSDSKDRGTPGTMIEKEAGDSVTVTLFYRSVENGLTRRSRQRLYSEVYDSECRAQGIATPRRIVELLPRVTISKGRVR
eukprot:COSAG02_NODE_2814_length_7971_cov_4.403455_9_plen_189_part_00